MIMAQITVHYSTDRDISVLLPVETYEDTLISSNNEIFYPDGSWRRYRCHFAYLRIEIRKMVSIRTSVASFRPIPRRWLSRATIIRKIVRSMSRRVGTKRIEARIHRGRVGIDSVAGHSHANFSILR